MSSCQVESSNNSLQPFFDIDDFLEKELTSMSNLSSIKKIVTINGETNESILQTFDLKKDLEIFRNSNINKVAWLDKYEVDSTLSSQGELLELNYSTTNKKLKTKEVNIKYDTGKIGLIKIKNAASSLVSNIEQQLIYTPQKGYSILSKQNVTLSDEQILKIIVEFK